MSGEETKAVVAKLGRHMSTENSPYIFISYRRHDSSSASRWLYKSIQRTFGPDSVFMDTESIRVGAKYPQIIENALRKATLMIVMIGPNWLKLTDDYNRRRIDKDEDWVRKETAFALANNVGLIPLLISKTPMPDKAALNPSVEDLVYHQAFELRDEHWEHDLSLLLKMLEMQGFGRRTEHPIRYPKPRITLNELTPEEFEEAKKRLDYKWVFKDTEIPGQFPMTRTEFHRVFEFASFKDAIDFIAEASKHISEMDHHPRWENIWRSVSVWLSTWDIGSKPSKLDVALAQYLEELFASYPRRKRGPKRA